MSRQSNGNYIQPANTAAVSGQTISSTNFNTLITDIGTEITNSIDRGGRSAMTAALPMGAQKITGMADPTVATDGATKNYVDTATAAFFSTGDVKLTIKTIADTGWVLFDDGGIGSATSGATTRANADTQALFTLIFNNISDGYAPIFTSGGGATTRAAQTNAASAWAANCRISLTKMLGRALGIAGNNGSGNVWSLGGTTGAETHTLSTAEIPSHTHSNTLNDPGHAHGTQGAQPIWGNWNGVNNDLTITNPAGGSSGSKQSATASATTSITITNAAQGGGTAHSIMQPTTFLNAMIKL